MNQEIRNAVIESAEITTAEPGFLDCWITLDYGGSGQGFGGWMLYLPKSWTDHKIEGPAGHWIVRCMEVAQVTKWSDMKGRTVRVKATHYGVSAIGHIVKDDWFCPEEDFKALKKEPQ